MKKILIVDFSPVLYRFAFSSTNIAKKELKLKKQNGFFSFDDYKHIYIYLLFKYIAKFKYRFDVDEVVLGIDSKPYWRKKIWKGYKYNRYKYDKSGIEWKKVNETSKEIIDILKKSTSFKVIDLKGVEGDDCLFVLSEYLSSQNCSITVKSVDHDIIYTLLNKNVKYYRTRHIIKNETDEYVEISDKEIKNLKYEHCFFGDKGDNIVPITAYTKFSNEFKELYPKIKELDVWEKRFEIEQEFFKKYNKNAYDHPRFGKKSYLKKQKKEGFTDIDFLKKNKIHMKNFILNSKISLPEYIPDKIKKEIIEKYNEETEKNPKILYNWLMENNQIELLGYYAFFIY